MKDMMTAPFMVEMIRTATNMYDHGWDERNGGNISLMLDEDVVKEYLDVTSVLRTIPTGFTAPELDGKYFLVTGTGKYFKNVQYAPDVNLGIVCLKEQGQQNRPGEQQQFRKNLPACEINSSLHLSTSLRNKKAEKKKPDKKSGISTRHLIQLTISDE